MVGMEAGAGDNTTARPDISTSPPGLLYITPTGIQIYVTYFIVCMLTFIIAIWIIGLNIIVIYTLMFHKRNTNVTYYFVSALSLADLVTGLVLIYITTYSLVQFQNTWECTFRFGLAFTVSQSSYAHLLALTIDRYVKIISPLKYIKYFTKKKVIIVSVLVWIFSLIMGALPMFGWRNDFRVRPEENNPESDSSEVEDSKNSDNQTYDTEIVCRFFGVLPKSYFIFNIVMSVLALSMTIFLHGRIVYVARKNHNEKKAQALEYAKKKTSSVSSITKNLDEHAWRLTKIILIVVVVSSLCWIPGITVIFLHIFGVLDHLDMEERGDIITYCTSVAFLNSLINPIIYAAKIRIVKQRFRFIFCCDKSDLRIGRGSTVSRVADSIQRRYVSRKGERNGNHSESTNNGDIKHEQNGHIKICDSERHGHLSEFGKEIERNGQNSESERIEKLCESVNNGEFSEQEQNGHIKICESERHGHLSEFGKEVERNGQNSESESKVDTLEPCQNRQKGHVKFCECDTHGHISEFGKEVERNEHTIESESDGNHFKSEKISDISKHKQNGHIKFCEYKKHGHLLEFGKKAESNEMNLESEHKENSLEPCQKRQNFDAMKNGQLKTIELADVYFANQ